MAAYNLSKTQKAWQVQEAKAMFSEVIRAASENPQIITVHGKETSVILSIDEFKKLTAPRQTIFEFFQNSPLGNLKLELPERQPEKTREIQL